MKYRLRFDERAIQEADEAYVYYETQQKGLGDRFRDELEKCIEYIQKNKRRNKRSARAWVSIFNCLSGNK